MVRGDSFSVLSRAIKQYEPVAVIALGQANRSAISIERVAINVDDFSIEDNIGTVVTDTPVIVGAPSAYWSTLPIKELKSCLEEEDIPVNISNSAGTFVCNHLFYNLQHALKDSEIRSGFIHVPLLPEQVTSETQKSMTLDTVSYTHLTLPTKA